MNLELKDFIRALSIMADNVASKGDAETKASGLEQSLRQLIDRLSYEQLHPVPPREVNAWPTPEQFVREFSVLTFGQQLLFAARYINNASEATHFLETGKV